MAKIFVQFLVIINSDNFPKSIHNLDSKFCTMLNKFSPKANDFKYCQSGLISHNLVTLMGMQLGAEISESQLFETY